MARKPTKARPKQDHRTITPARRAVLYDQWLNGRSLEELSAKWRKPMHRINEALVMERAERKMAQSIIDRDQRKVDHEVVIEPPQAPTFGESYDFECPREPAKPEPERDDLIRCTILDATILPENPGIVPNDVVEFRDPTTGERLGAIINVATPEPARPVADIIEDAIKRRLG